MVPKDHGHLFPFALQSVRRVERSPLGSGESARSGQLRPLHEGKGGRTRDRPRQNCLVGYGPADRGLHEEGQHILADGLLRAPHAVRRPTEHLPVLLQGQADLLASVLRVRKAPRGKERVRSSHPGCVGIGKQRQDRVEVGRGGELDLPARGGVLIGGKRSREDVGLDLGEGLFVFLGKTLPPGNKACKRPSFDGLRVEPSEVEPDLHVSKLIDGEAVGTGRPSQGSARFPLAGELQVAGEGLRARMVRPLAHPFHEESPFDRGEFGGRLEGVVPVDVFVVAGGVRLELFHQGRHQIEGVMEVGIGGEREHHVGVVLERMHAHPRHVERPGQRRPVERLMHVPDERYMKWLRRRHPSLV